MTDLGRDFDPDISEIDPQRDWCPWCGAVRRWKGNHAAAKHPDEWDEFKEYFERTNGRIRWKRP